MLVFLLYTVNGPKKIRYILRNAGKYHMYEEIKHACSVINKHVYLR